MSDAKIFIVEDEGLIALDLQTNLERVGFTVCGIADNAFDALEGINSSKPDLVLMDIRIKGDRDGIWTAAQVRMRFNLPVVMVTAHGDEETLDRARLAEPYGFIVKPFINHNFRTHLQTVIWKHQAENQTRTERAWLASTLDHVSGGVIVTDSYGAINYMNPEAERLTAWTIKEAKGLALLEALTIYEETTGFPVITPIHFVHEGVDPDPGPKTYQLFNERRLGVMLVEVTVSVNRDVNGLVGLVVRFQDVTQMVIGSLRERQRERLQSIDSLAFGLGRDLAAMLEPLKLCLTQIYAEVPQNLKERANAARSDANEVLEWIAQLDELGVQKLKDPIQVDLNLLLRDVARDRGLGLVGSWPCKLDLATIDTYVTTDVKSCRRNIFRALREFRLAMPRGGTIHISTQQIAKEIVLCVREAGEQIQLGAADRVFDPYQFPRFRSLRSNGLAMTLLRHFMELTGGVAECSCPGMGGSPMIVLRFPQTQPQKFATTA